MIKELFTCVLLLPVVAGAGDLYQIKPYEPDYTNNLAPHFIEPNGVMQPKGQMAPRFTQPAPNYYYNSPQNTYTDPLYPNYNNLMEGY
jgi:hypothetical protein